MSNSNDIVEDEVIPVRPGEMLDWVAIRQYLQEHMPGLDGPLTVRQFPNGNANLTYLLRLGDIALVLRRAPFGRIAPGAHDMRREYRALSNLWRSFDRAPRALLFCDDPAIAGADFFVMEYRSGVGMWDRIPDPMTHHIDVGRRMGLAVVDALADLHCVDPQTCDLTGLGKPDGFLNRQLQGWSKRWNLVAPELPLPAMQAASQILEETCPLPQRAVVLHNDFKVNNCQFRAEDPDRVYSVFDWDMATLGDPLIDFGTMLNYWPDPSDQPTDRGIYLEGFEQLGLPTHQEVIARYEARTNLDLTHVSWYIAFAAWKTAIVLQQLYDRYLRGETTDERMSTRGERVSEQAARAARILRSGHV